MKIAALRNQATRAIKKHRCKRILKVVSVRFEDIDPNRDEDKDVYSDCDTILVVKWAS